MLDHKHMIIRAEVNNPPKDTDVIKTWLKSLISGIRMKLISGIDNNPVALYCDVPSNRGLTAIAIIETSHIALHAWDEDEPSIIQLDVYSCSDFSPSEIVTFLQVFEPVKIEYKFLNRNTGLQEII